MSCAKSLSKTPHNLYKLLIKKNNLIHSCRKCHPNLIKSVNMINCVVSVVKLPRLCFNL